VLLAFTAASAPLSISGMQIGMVALAVLAAAVVGRSWNVVRRTPLDGVLAICAGALALSTVVGGHVLQAGDWLRHWVALAYFVVFWWLRDRDHARRLALVVVIAGGVAGAYGILQHFTGADWYRALFGFATRALPRVPGAQGFAVVGFFRNYLTFAHAMIFPLAWAGAFAVAGVAGIAVAWSTGLREQAAPIFTLGGENTARLEIWRANLGIIHDHPLLGLGFGRCRGAPAAPYYDRHPEADRRSHAHSNVLQVAAEGGLLGLAAVCLVFAVILRRGFGAIASARSPGEWATVVGGCTGMVTFLLAGLTQYNLGDAEVAIGMWITTAVLMRCAEGA